MHCLKTDMKILLATKNKGKISELKRILTEELNTKIEIVSLSDVGMTGEIEENGTTFEENALIKAQAGADFSGLITVADDSGLTVRALGGAPGIYSARYADDVSGGHDDSANNAKLIRELRDKSDRTAAYVCAIACVFPEAGAEPIVVSGSVQGEIIDEPRGNGGFGYDPYFYYPPFGKTFAEIPAEQKNSVSHRGNALRLLAGELKKRI